MKKLLCLALVAIIAMSFMLTAAAADTVTFPTLNEAFVALSDFMKLEAIMGFVNKFHDAMGGFYEQFDVLLRGVRVAVNGFLGGVFAG